jgi:hypothetical protein
MKVSQQVVWKAVQKAVHLADSMVLQMAANLAVL